MVMDAVAREHAWENQCARRHTCRHIRRRKPQYPGGGAEDSSGLVGGSAEPLGQCAARFGDHLTRHVPYLAALVTYQLRQPSVKVRPHVTDFADGATKTASHATRSGQQEKSDGVHN